ncbi:MAG: hypothetical protein ACYTF3_13455 [Planctomycetota bacterium]
MLSILVPLLLAAPAPLQADLTCGTELVLDQLAACPPPLEQVVLYRGPRGGEAFGPTQEFTLGALSGIRIEPTRLSGLLDQHLGGERQPEALADYTQASWSQVQAELPETDEVLRVVVMREGWVLLAVEVPLVPPTSLGHAQAREQALGLWDAAFSLILEANMRAPLIDLSTWDGLTIPGQDWIHLPPQDQGCPGPILLEPVFEFDPQLYLPQLIEIEVMPEPEPAAEVTEFGPGIIISDGC